jgi:hypothetical protein
LGPGIQRLKVKGRGGSNVLQEVENQFHHHFAGDDDDAKEIKLFQFHPNPCHFLNYVRGLLMQAMTML